MSSVNYRFLLCSLLIGELIFISPLHAYGEQCQLFQRGHLSLNSANIYIPPYMPTAYSVIIFNGEHLSLNIANIYIPPTHSV